MSQEIKEWIDTAEALKPELNRTDCRPCSLVTVVPDSAAFQGWTVQQIPGLDALPSRPLGRGDSFILDFGEHLVGHLRLTVESTMWFLDSPVRLKLIFGETPAEVAEPFDPYDAQLSRAWLQDEIVNIDILPHTLQLPRRYAFQYLKIVVVDTSPAFQVTISDIVCEAVTSAEFALPPLEGAFPDDVRELDTISLRTLRSCMQTVFEDGPKRDRRLWLGDLRLQALTNAVSFKNHDLVKRCLYLFAGLPQENDTVIACVYEVPTPHIGHCFILDYAALFGPTLLDFARASGDWDTARELWPVALRQMEYVLEFVNEDGLFIDPGNLWIFIDWQANLDKQASMHGVAVYMLRQMAALARALGRDKDAARVPAHIEKLTAAARRSFLDAETGLYHSGDSRQISWASQAWMIIAGVMTDQEGARALRALEALTDAVKPAGPYLYHHVVEAMVQCGMQREAAALLRHYWGGMARHGASTFWEVYDPGNAFLSPYNSHLINSYCHAWSCTPAYFIRTYPEMFVE